jgi:hypothetical protein
MSEASAKHIVSMPPSFVTASRQDAPAKPGKALRILGHIIVGAFFFWHAAAIAIYAIPLNTADPLMRPLRSRSMSVIAPYVLSSGQWQQWNLFSPDPLRRVTRYRIEARADGGEWQALQELNPQDYNPLRHANYAKMFIGILEEDQETYKTAVARHFLLRHCASRELASGTSLRMAYIYYIVPRPISFTDAMRPAPWPPMYFQRESDTAYCP